MAAPITVGEGQDWAVLVEIPESAILADAHSLRTTILIGALVTLLLSPLPPVRGRPQRRRARSTPCASRMEEIADGDGDLTARVDETRKDEFGRLGAAFNRFVAKVADTVAGIGRASGSLTELSAGHVRRLGPPRRRRRAHRAPVAAGVRRGRAGVAQRADRRGRRRGDGRQHPRDRAPTPTRPPGSPARR